jgi:hypothetical protein
MSKITSTEITNNLYNRKYGIIEYTRKLERFENEKLKEATEQARRILAIQLMKEIEKIREYESIRQKKQFEIHQRGSNIDTYI